MHLSVRARRLLAVVATCLSLSTVAIACRVNELADYHERMTVLRPVVQARGNPVIETDLDALEAATRTAGENGSFAQRWIEAANREQMNAGLTESFRREFADFFPLIQVVETDEEVNAHMTIAVEQCALRAASPREPARVYFRIKASITYVPEGKLIWEWEGEYEYVVQEHWILPRQLERGPISMATVARLSSNDLTDMFRAVLVEDGLGYDLVKQMLHDRDHPEE